MSHQQLAGKSCLITGGSSGIGRAIAEEFARQGASVAVLARQTDELKEVTNQIECEGGTVKSLPADVTDAARMNRAVDEVVQAWGQLDIVVANAGINGVWAPLDELTVDQWRQTLDINLTGTFITLRAATSAMRKRGGVAIVVSSVNGNRVFSTGGASAYATSKAGQVALTKMLALELAKYKIRVNAVCPGAIETPIHEKTIKRDIEAASEPAEYPGGRIPLTDGKAGSPEQVASVALFLATEQSSHVTGSVIYVDGAQSLLQG